MSGVLCFFLRVRRRRRVRRVRRVRIVRRVRCVWTVGAITQTKINITFSYLVEWKNTLQGGPLLLVVKIGFKIWPPGGVNHRENHIFVNIFQTKSPRRVKPGSNESSHQAGNFDYYKMAIWFPRWPLGHVFRHKNHNSFNIFWTERPSSTKPIIEKLFQNDYLIAHIRFLKWPLEGVLCRENHIFACIFKTLKGQIKVTIFSNSCISKTVLLSHIVTFNNR